MSEVGRKVWFTFLDPIRVFTAHFEFLKHQLIVLYIACWFAVSKNVSQIILQAFSYLKARLGPCLMLPCLYISYSWFLCACLLSMQQAHLFTFSLTSKCTRHSLLVSLLQLKALLQPFFFVVQTPKHCKKMFLPASTPPKYIDPNLLYTFQNLKFEYYFAALFLTIIT